MLKKDIEKVLLKSYDYFKSNFGQNMDIGELKKLSDWIMEEMNKELEIENQIRRQYIVTNFALNMLKSSGNYEFKDIMGNIITLGYENKNETPSVLESGTMIVWDNNVYDDPDKINNPGKNMGNKSYQSILGCRTSRKIPHHFMNTKIDFNKNLHSINNLIFMCMDLNWKEKVESLNEIRKLIIKEKMNRCIMDGKQKTITDYVV